ncbi:hypothetical protein [Isachenkonia alkalipeptolytica]|uniref:Uncharacterized protein n=1 Tax=Isachenkonia alkalipeptolytica TaxID=2565777 RepID=A0AA43XLK3_9CLOT|nr:hypothetical protein [Isachenkonia alkalipeptolytica]NBG88651.1 hypothetical protein [Isachenkonia alkalipeptolytica]
MNHAELLTEEKVKSSLEELWRSVKNEEKDLGIIWLSVDGKLHKSDVDEDIFSPGGHKKGPRKVLDRLHSYFVAITKFLCVNPEAEIFISADHGMHANMNSYIIGNSTQIEYFDINRYFHINEIGNNDYIIKKGGSRAVFIEIATFKTGIIEALLKLKSANIIKMIVDYNNGGNVVENIHEMVLDNKYLIIPCKGKALNKDNKYIGEHGGIEFDEFIVPYINLNIEY